VEIARAQIQPEVTARRANHRKRMVLKVLQLQLGHRGIRYGRKSKGHACDGNNRERFHTDLLAWLRNEVARRKVRPTTKDESRQISAQSVHLAIPRCERTIQRLVYAAEK
jgi:hypothetical protein